MLNGCIIMQISHHKRYNQGVQQLKLFPVLPRLNIAIPSPASEIIFIEFITKLGMLTCHLINLINYQWVSKNEIHQKNDLQIDKWKFSNDYKWKCSSFINPWTISSKAVKKPVIVKLFWIDYKWKCSIFLNPWTLSIYQM